MTVYPVCPASKGNTTKRKREPSQFPFALISAGSAQAGVITQERLAALLDRMHYLLKILKISSMSSMLAEASTGTVAVCGFALAGFAEV